MGKNHTSSQKREGGDADSGSDHDREQDDIAAQTLMFTIHTINASDQDKLSLRREVQNFEIFNFDVFQYIEESSENDFYIAAIDLYLLFLSTVVDNFMGNIVGTKDHPHDDDVVESALHQLGGISSLLDVSAVINFSSNTLLLKNVYRFVEMVLVQSCGRNV